MEPILEAAVLEEKHLLERRNEIDAKLAKLKDFIAMHAELSAKFGNVTASSHVVNVVPQKSATVSASGGHVATSVDVVEFAERSLANGQWKPTETIHDELTKAGYVIKAMHQVTRVSQMLSASNKFQAQRGKGWALKDVAPKAEAAIDLL